MNKKQSDIHAQALVDFGNIATVTRKVREECRDDRRFYSITGAQWEGALGEQFANRPKLEINKTHLSVMRIINEYRNNRITVDFLSKTGDEGDTLADVCNGLYRSAEEFSVADEAYDNAFEEAAGGGFGAWRLRADYVDDEDEDNDEQHILIEPIFDADTSVYFDLDAKRQDKSDARFCFVLTSLTHSAYKDEYGESPSSWPKDMAESHGFEWATSDVVYVAELYMVEEAKERIVEYTSFADTDAEKKQRFAQDDLDNDPETQALLKATGATITMEKTVKRRKVRKYIMSGGAILEDCGYIAGTLIPIVPVYGKRWFVDNVERYMGHVRLVKDAQRVKNMQTSLLGEMSGRSPFEKPIFTQEQIQGHENVWSQDAVTDYAYLTINTMEDANGNPIPAGPVGYTKPPILPPATAALLQIIDQDMSDLLGNQEAGEEIEGNISGKAVELIQARLDMQSFIYMSNMAKAVKRSGEIFLSMARDVFVEQGRKLKTVGGQGEVSQVELMRLEQDKNGNAYTANDLSQAKFDVAVDVGPSSSSKRSSTVRSLMGMMQITTDPETLQVLSSMAMMNMEGEGISDVRAYFRKRLVTMGVVTPTDAERKELEAAQAQPQEPGAQELYLAAEAEKSTAQAQKALADTEKTMAEIGETKADTLKTLSEIESSRMEAARTQAAGLQGAASQPPAQGMRFPPQR